MREWDEEISQWLSRMKPESTREARLIEEARRRLDDRYRISISQGATEQEAYREALAALNEGLLFAPPLSEERPLSGATGFVEKRRRNMFGGLWRNLRYGARTLLKTPGFTAIAVLTLALGVGATTAIFSVVHATLFEPMRYPKPDQLMMVWTKFGDARNSTSAGDYLEWKRRNTSFQYLEAWAGGSFNVATAERPEQVECTMFTPDFDRMIGDPIPRFMGRSFLPEEGQPGKDRVVILDHRLWNKSFGADREIIGKQIRMNGEAYTVIGVGRPGQADHIPISVSVPLAFKPVQITHEAHWLLVMGRLKDGVSQAQAQAEMQEIARQLAQEHPKSNANKSVSVEPLHNNFLPKTTIKNLWMLLGAVGFLLLIACVNVANMLLARGTTRQREVAVRGALGASRGQLFRQFLTESLLLAVAGGALGVYLAWLMIDVIMRFVPVNMLPYEADVRISVPVLLFTIAATMLAGLLFGCAPAWQSSRLDLNEVMKQGGRAGTGRRGVRRALVVVEFALALTLLAGGGLALRSFWNLTRVDLGVRTERVLTFFLPTAQSRFSEPGQVAPYYRQLLEKIEAVPGVESAAVTTGMPIRGWGFGMAFSIVGAPPVDPAARPGARFHMVTPGYFETFGVRVVKGRHFSEQDTAGVARVAMVNEYFVNRYFPGVDPLTQRVAVDELIPGGMKPGPPVEWQIVGVFHNVRNGERLREDNPEIYVPFWQSPWPQASMAVRTAGDPAGMTKSIAAAVNSIDPDLPLAGVRTMDQHVSEILAFDRFGMVLYGSFAALALLLAAVGIYGVMNFAVAQRSHEFGVRMALGAGGANILSMVLKEGGTLAFIGLVFGLGGAYLVGRAMHTTLYGVSAMDIGSFSAAALTLLAAALAACYLPARRASKVDPIVALRVE